MSTSKGTIFLDMDGVLVDLVGQIFGYFLEHDPDAIASAYSEINGWDAMPSALATEGVTVSSREMWAEISSLGPSFWEFLGWTPHGESILAASRAVAKNLNLRLALLTHPADDKSYKGKMNWVKHHNVAEPLICVREKETLANPTTFLIDDAAHNLEAFEKAGGTTYRMPQPWNGGGEFSLSNYSRTLTDWARRL